MTTPSIKTPFFVNTPNPVPPHRFEVDESTTILSIKEQLVALTNIPVANQVLKYAGQVCKDNDILKNVLRGSLRIFHMSVA
jgi:hypothetical protein